MPTLGRKTCFNTGVGDDDGTDDVMLIFVLVNPVADRNVFFNKTANTLTRTCVCFRFYSRKSRRDRYPRAGLRGNDMRYETKGTFSRFRCGSTPIECHDRKDHIIMV